ncbi:DUF3857 domain-containing transglutaminase family protein [Erythrobacter sp. F6033]|uniref:DUF3857 domain-containing transglutaminase family protein n=1 Tax=Erythrobacter sp. F6033 TaxID=2926401 RepID=UPI001FF2B9D0|nr:DUF3857 domain-containing transglutaminase family protein [Erythrobacter sp. F6033]MCK0128875.1 DUF3857 domain-containing transglutaminase family protein [Erythrobacter sp. F6033]
MRFGLVFAAMLMASTAQAQTAEAPDIEITPTPDWITLSEPLAVPDNAQGGVFVRAQDTVVRLTNDGERTFQAQIMRILQPQALSAGNIGITWNPAAGSAHVHSLKIRRGSRVIDVLETSTFEILRREDQLETAMLDGLLTAVLQVPDLRVGDDLELSYSIPSHDPTLQSANSGILFLAHSPPGGRFHLELQWEDEQEPALQLTPTFEEAARRGDNSISVTFDNPEVLSPPRAAPPRYSLIRMLQYSDFQDWASVSTRFHTLFDEARKIAPGSPLQDEAALIAETHSEKLAQAQAALTLVQQQVRYIYVGLNGGNFTPASADETWERRYGDCKGKTAMLLALLDQLGIEAEAVLVNNNFSTDGLDKRLASPGAFDHVLVRATIDGEAYWLDGTMPPVIEGRTKPFFKYDWVLPLKKAGGELEQLAFEPFDIPQEMGIEEIDATAGFDVPSKKILKSVIRGSAGLQEYYTFSSVSPNQLESALRNQLEGTQMWNSVDSVEWRFDKATQASILTITGTGPVEWESDSLDGRYMFLPRGGFTPPPRRQRNGQESGKIPFYQAPSYTCHATTVRLPEGTELKNWGFNSVFDTMLYGEVYYRMMEKRDDRTLRMVRGRRVETPEITAARAKRDNERLENFDNSKAILSYDPSQEIEAWGNLRSVPATYEIDWAGRDTPCLPPDMLE